MIDGKAVRPEASSTVLSRRLRALIVDDNDDDARIVELHLRNAGWGMESRRVDTDSGLRDALTEDWDVVLCDYRMPQMSPNRALETLRELGRDIPLIVVSGTISQEEGAELIAAGANDFFSKSQLALLSPAIERETSARQERARSRREARAQEEVFRLLVDSVAEYAIFMLDTDGRVRTWNRGAERLKGYRESEILGRHFSVFYPAEAIRDGKPDRALHVALDSGQYREQGWRVRKGGTRFWADVTLAVVRDENGAHRGFAKITRDETTRVHSEQSLREAEDRFRLFVDSVTEYAMFMLDIDGRVATWNIGAQRLKGYAADEIIGSHFSRFYLPEDLAAGKPRRELEIATRTGLYREEGWRLRKDGTRFWADVTITAIRDHTGTLRGFAKVTRDMTDRKQADDTLRGLATQLEHRVAERTSELETLNEELESFAHSVSHDLRAPLRSVRFFSEQVLRRADSGLDAENRDNLRRVVTNATHMGELIEALLRLSFAARAPIRQEQVDLTAMSQALLHGLKEADPRRDVVTSVRPGLTATGDRKLLGVALQNLLSNAWKFTRHTATARIEVGMESKNGERVYFVRDNGAGFDDSHAHHLFGAFQRLHSDSEFEGTGIGLATARRIISRHHGRIWAEAAPDRGATFFFTLGDRGRGGP